ncbi:hypothetical protein LC087_09695 [Bacillus carboniphilus]|uniref:Big-1 domain-containing protein n=1 Tax=Bacillus carboniphilus TaxID=86663 RepID=A0ABY9JPB3_9BACI|nr:hypothetical protein [Bacillus carboniphilus]WLR41216.1 hypothetical protein LC087_09695 [Bacillus carboniphilus]
MNLFLPDLIVCEGVISGSVTTDGVPDSGVDVTFSSSAGVFFSPNPSVTDESGNFASTVSVGGQQAAITATANVGGQQDTITATANVNGQQFATIGLTEITCGSESNFRTQKS